MRREMQNADTRELTAQEIDAVEGGSFWGIVAGAVGGAIWGSAAADAERRAEAVDGTK